MTMMTHLASVVLWGFVATIDMTTVMRGAQGLGMSRLSLPFLFGTAVTGRLDLAYVLRHGLYALGGWSFAFLYHAIFMSLGHQSWWFGSLIGLGHGTFLLAGLMHLPVIHPRMISEYDRPRTGRAVEPPGFFGLHYGRQTPLSTLLGHALYGAILGAALPAV